MCGMLATMEQTEHQKHSYVSACIRPFFQF
jgi:hypothetical protein